MEGTMIKSGSFIVVFLGLFLDHGVSQNPVAIEAQSWKNKVVFRFEPGPEDTLKIDYYAVSKVRKGVYRPKKYFVDGDTLKVSFVLRPSPPSRLSEIFIIDGIKRESFLHIFQKRNPKFTVLLERKTSHLKFLQVRTSINVIITTPLN